MLRESQVLSNDWSVDRWFEAYKKLDLTRPKMTSMFRHEVVQSAHHTDCHTRTATALSQLRTTEQSPETSTFKNSIDAASLASTMNLFIMARRAFVMDGFSVRLSFQLTLSVLLLTILSPLLVSTSEAGIPGASLKGLDQQVEKVVPQLLGTIAQPEAEKTRVESPTNSGENIRGGQLNSDKMLLRAETGVAVEERRCGSAHDNVASVNLENRAEELEPEIQSTAESVPVVSSSFQVCLAGLNLRQEHIQLLQRLALLTRAELYALGIGLIDSDEEAWHRCITLVEEDARTVMPTEESHQPGDFKLSNSARRKVLQADISPPGMWQGDDSQIDLDNKRSLLSVREDSEIAKARNLNRSRRLLADISPPGMWSDDGDDPQDKYQKRRLLADISPPGMWDGSDDQFIVGDQK